MASTGARALRGNTSPARARRRDARYLRAALTATLLAASAPASTQDAFRPPVIRDGATIEQTRELLGPACRKLEVRSMKVPFIVMRGVVKREQQQIDCDGLVFEGAPRWAEFVFADDALEMVWIMTRPEDEQPLLRLMTDHFGPPTHRNARFIAFANARAALRLDVPEVLFYSPRLAAGIEGWFAKNSTFR